MSNLNPEILRQFLANPEAMLNADFAMWGTSSFITTSSIVEHLINTNPRYPLIPRLTMKMIQYMKYCYDNDKEFPWEGTFPSTPQKSSKEQFVEFYNSQIDTLTQ